MLLYWCGLPKKGSGCEPLGGVTLMADRAAVESSGRELITASANWSAALLTVGGYSGCCAGVVTMAASAFCRIPAARARRTSRDAVFMLTRPAVGVVVESPNTSSNCQARIPFLSNTENSGRPTASVYPPPPSGFTLAEVGISGRDPPEFVTV